MADAAKVAAKIAKASWQQTMLRVKDPKKSLHFYTNVMGMTHVDTLDFPENKFCLYFLTTIKSGDSYPYSPGSTNAHKWLWSTNQVTLELTHNYGTEDKEDFTYHPGNKEKDGFGHIAFNTKDVYAACSTLEEAGVSFKKKPDEGRMKGLAFAYDPDGYWVEIVSRGDKDAGFENTFNFSQTMLRVKDPKKSVAFYESLGMTLVREMHLNDFSLFFMSTLPEGVSPPDPKSAEARDFVMGLFNPVLELTHNHGTENDENFQHFVGNEDGKKGFGHIGFLVDDVYEACETLAEQGYGMKKAPDDGKMKGLAFALDPDGYWLEICKRGAYDDQGTIYKKRKRGVSRWKKHNCL